MECPDTCVIIPTFNNAATLAGVIRDVQAITPNIIVVNDGSTDDTASIAEAFPGIDWLGYTPNRGKGWALRKGFDRARHLGYRYAISIDSDGQHYARDLPVFIAAIRNNPDALVIGARNMDQASVPGGSSFGNRFSNFWFTLETGIHSPDTQSGYRLYPLEPLRKIRFVTRKYEFEIEVIVRAAWRGIPILSVPVSVYYPPAEERVTHFRPFKDFTRISVLNSVLVLLTFLYVKPMRLFKPKHL
jgi:glycosyltransferase involved in cell wall biosynthesis